MAVSWVEGYIVLIVSILVGCCKSIEGTEIGPSPGVSSLVLE